MPQPMCHHHHYERSATSSASIARCRLLVWLKLEPEEFRAAIDRMALVLDEPAVLDTQCRFDGGPRCPLHEA